MNGQPTIHLNYSTKTNFRRWRTKRNGKPSPLHIIQEGGGTIEGLESRTAKPMLQGIDESRGTKERIQLPLRGGKIDQKIILLQSTCPRVKFRGRSQGESGGPRLWVDEKTPNKASKRRNRIRKETQGKKKDHFGDVERGVEGELSQITGGGDEVDRTWHDAASYCEGNGGCWGKGHG